ncbi:MAG: LOG family protein [Anaerolineaceae bacterium]|nr:LOG family protein [Anaerolineaceae bacterium]
MNITVFGGSQTQPGENAYLEAMRLGRLLASAGHTVLTGGYIGAMEAVSRGAAEAGGHVIGVTCQEIENWRDITPNAWVEEERRFGTLRERLYALIDGCDAAMALPGGPGTLAEIALMWNSMIIAAMPARPLILIGTGWEDVFEEFFFTQDAYVAERDRRLLTFVDDEDEAVLELNHIIENRE